jgi:Zn-dependent M16 (insulinase) family peptidase
MEEIYGFELLREQDIGEIQTRARLYRHRKTGAELLSLINDDENKVFGITFRTPPRDSTGVPHILEHSVLCGSRKYPVKEPFVEILKGSLQTFLNAFTYPDKTCYPVASQNTKDFYNLVDVYLDAVFYPRITEHIFQQEGWHFEIEKEDSPLGYKGVVFNEMKGAYSSPDNLLAEYSQQSLFPDTTYGLDSGGDPRVIPSLTYEAFRDFHRRYYHPSNSRIFFHGDDDPDERLRLINNYLKDFEKLDIDSAVSLQSRFGKPRSFVFPFASGKDDPSRSKGMVTVNWLLTETTEIEMNVALTILGYILMGTPGSPLRKALIDSGLGEDVTGLGLERDLRQMVFSVGLKGIDLTKAQDVEDLVLERARGGGGGHKFHRVHPPGE